MKIIVLIAAVMFPFFADAYQCTGVDSSGNAIIVNTEIFARAQIATINLQIDGKSYKDIAQFTYFHDDNMGHSRCPGSWDGIKFVSNSSDSIFESLAVIYSAQFSGCGISPADSISLKIDDKTENFVLNCK